MMLITLGDILQDVSRFSWKEWVYVHDPSSLTILSECLVINTDDTELGVDDFTPVVAEREKMQEFLSVQDLGSVLDNFKTWKPEAGLDEKCNAAIFYFVHDAYLPKS